MKTIYGLILPFIALIIPGYAFTQYHSIDLYADSILARPDSLDLRSIRGDISKAELRVRHTDIWQRLIPQIHISASFGINDLIFVDPSSFVPYIFPKDAYRLSVSVSINEIFSFDKHKEAELDLEQLLIKHDRLKGRIMSERSGLILKLSEIESLTVIGENELKLREDILKFKTLCFRQGKIDYDELLGSQLDLNNIRKEMVVLSSRRFEIFSKLYVLNTN